MNENNRIWRDIIKWNIIQLKLESNITECSSMNNDSMKDY